MINQLRTKAAVLEQEIKDKEQLLQKTSELLTTEQTQKVVNEYKNLLWRVKNGPNFSTFVFSHFQKKVEDEIERKKRHIVKLEASVKTISDEVVKANEIIKKLQGEIRTYHSKVNKESIKAIHRIVYNQFIWSIWDGSWLFFF